MGPGSTVLWPAWIGLPTPELADNGEGTTMGKPGTTNPSPPTAKHLGAPASKN